MKYLTFLNLVLKQRIKDFEILFWWIYLFLNIFVRFSYSLWWSRELFIVEKYYWWFILAWVVSSLLWKNIIVELFWQVKLFEHLRCKLWYIVILIRMRWYKVWVLKRMRWDKGGLIRVASRGTTRSHAVW